MNERIRQLAEQANTIGDWGEDITEGRYFVYPNIKNLEKFAELIVGECASVCENSNYEFGTIFTKMINFFLLEILKIDLWILNYKSG